jgi:hypothetical protein
MSDSPIFDQMVREFQQNTGRTYADLCKPSREPVIVPNRPTLTRRPTTPFRPQQDQDTMRIPRVVPLQQMNNVA